MVSHPELGSDPPIRSDRESRRDITRDDFMSIQRDVEHITSIYMTINALVVRHLYMNFLVVIL